MPLAKNVYTKNEYFGISNCVFNFNFLALVVSEILGGVPNLHQGALRPPEAPSGKMVTHAQVLANIYIIVNFQLRSSINAGLTERSLYNRFCIERSPKMVFLGVGAKIFCGNHANNATTANLRRL